MTTTQAKRTTKFVSGDPHQIEAARASAVARGERAKLKVELLQGRRTLASVIDNPSLGSMQMQRVVQLCLTTRASNLDRRFRPNTKRSYRGVRILRQHDLVGHELVRNLSDKRRAAVAAAVDGHHAAAYRIRGERNGH